MKPVEELSREELIAQHYEMQATNIRLQEQLLKLGQELSELRRLVFGSKRERFVADQEASPVQGDKEANKQERVKPAKKANANHPGRNELPAHLPRVDIILEPQEDTTGMRCIGQEITEELEYEPGKLYVKRYIRPKYAPAGDQGPVLIAALPTRPIEKGIAGPGLLAQTLIDKYVDHIPCHRQGKRWEREGVNLPASTLCDWVAQSAGLLEVLYQALEGEVIAASYIQADESPIPVLDNQVKGKTHRGFYWVYHAPVPALVLYEYQPGRGREGPKQMLENFSGFLQSDGYIVYEDFKSRSDITLLCCMAHARRGFEKALDSDRQRAQYAMERIQELYAIERAAREQQLDAAARQALRAEQAVPLLDAFEQWLEEQQPQRKGKEEKKETQAEIDNILSGRNAIRPMALGRKNYLFAGSHEAAQRAAMIYSLMGTCLKHQVNPFVWLRDVLTRLPDHPIQQIGELLPHRWKPASTVAELEARRGTSPDGYLPPVLLCLSLIVSCFAVILIYLFVVRLGIF